MKTKRDKKEKPRANGLLLKPLNGNNYVSLVKASCILGPKHFVAERTENNERRVKAENAISTFAAEEVINRD